MKRIIIMAALILGSSTLSIGQDRALEAGKASDMVISHSTETTTNRMVTFFEEDFSNGLDGNNGLGAWTISDNSDDGLNSVWHMANADSPEGYYSSSFSSLNSTTSANGWMIFDGDGYYTVDGAAGGSFASLTGYLVSPSIDMSTYSTVILDFQQYFRYCCAGAFPLFVSVSTDGGATWTEFSARGSFGGGANNASDNAQSTSIDLSCMAANQSDVTIRFAYNPTGGNYSHYFWGVDDISIHEADYANDLQVNQVLNGDIYNYYEQTITPLMHAYPAADGGLTVGTIFENLGSATHNSTVITVEILDATGTVLSTTASAPFLLNANANSNTCPTTKDTIYMNTNWEPTEIGHYFLRSTISSELTDEAPANNVNEKEVEYTNAMFGQDSFGMFDAEIRQNVDADNEDAFLPTGFGNYYNILNAGTEASGLVVYLGPNTSEGIGFEGRIYKCLAGEGVNGDNATFVSTFFGTTAGQIPASVASPVATFLEFDSPVALDASGDFYYFASILTTEFDEGEISILTSNVVDNDFSTATYELGADEDYHWFNTQSAPGVRLAFGNDPLAVSINELDAIEGVSQVQISPNPVSNLSKITYSLANDTDIQVEITDINGKVIFTEYMGKQTVGVHSIDIDASNYSNGVYFYSLVSGNDKLTRKMIVNK